MFCTAVATRRPSSATSSTSSGVNASRSARTSPSMPIVRGPTCNGAQDTAVQTELESRSLLLRIARGSISRAGRRRWPSSTSSSTEPLTGLAEPGGKTVAVPAARHRHHLGPPALDQHDRDPVELDEAAQLTDERGERFVRRRGRNRGPARTGSRPRAGRRAARARPVAATASPARSSAIAASLPSRLTSQPTIAPVIRKTPNGNVTRSRREPGTAEVMGPPPLVEDEERKQSNAERRLPPTSP